MARFSGGGDSAVLGGRMPRATCRFAGMMYSTGSSVPTDYVSAHNGSTGEMRQQGSDRLRREIAEQMTERDRGGAARSTRLAAALIHRALRGADDIAARVRLGPAPGRTGRRPVSHSHEPLEDARARGRGRAPLTNASDPIARRGEWRWLKAAFG
jgi:hypothetical protein